MKRPPASSKSGPGAPATMKPSVMVMVCLLALPGLACGAGSPASSSVTQPAGATTTAMPGAPEPAQSPVSETLELDEPAMLARPALLRRALIAAIRAGHAEGMLLLLPVYEKSTNPDTDLLDHARAVRARLHNRPDIAARHYRQLLARAPNAHDVRLQLAQALLDDDQFTAAAAQLDLLPPDVLTDEFAEHHASLRQALRAREAWQFDAGVRLLNEDNINHAPTVRRSGNWTFPTPLRGKGLGYYASARKKWSLPHRLYYGLDVYAYGRQYIQHTRYSEATVSLAPGLGVTRSGSTLSLSPFLTHRHVGGRPYSHSAGARVQRDDTWAPRWQTLVAWEYAHSRHRKHPHLDHASHLASLSLVYSPAPGQYGLIAHDFYAQTGTRDRGDRFRHVGLRLAWERQWASGPGVRLGAGAGVRHYQGPTLFSHGANRRDTQHSLALSLWHQRIRHGGMTPRVTLSHQRVRSNDILFTHAKTHVLIEASRHF